VVFKELLRVFRGEDPARELMHDFGRMRELAIDLVKKVSQHYWNPPCSEEERRQIYEQDIEINKLERTIRKNMVTLLAGSSAMDHAHFLVLMSVAKDVERIGDYAKNLLEASAFHPKPLPDDENVKELADIWKLVERMLEEVAQTVQRSDVTRAQELNARGRATIQRCDGLVERIAQSDYPASVAVKLALGTRYYKRICGHMLNLLSSVIMPLHKLDYFDEKLLADDFD
jgi:phosphate transport system protein